MEGEFYHTLSAVQLTHWWYAARRRILSAVLQRELRKGVPDGVIYDLGCGTGCNLGLLSQFGRTIGIDSSPDAVRICKDQGFLETILGSVEDIGTIVAPTPGIIVMSDVLEHVFDEVTCIKDISERLPPNGLFIITVPAFEFLWGPSDEKSHHYRRYRKPHLKQLLEPYFSIEILTYFNTILFAPIAIGRMLECVFNRSGFEGAVLPPVWINNLLRKIMEFELPLIERGLPPFGVSLLAVLRSKKNLA